ncbi:MAG: hypothetical protein ABSC42_07175 [Tepidisphaeraceae bacterium]|jgi:hypothetical protein
MSAEGNLRAIVKIGSFTRQLTKNDVQFPLAPHMEVARRVSKTPGALQIIDTEPILRWDQLPVLTPDLPPKAPRDVVHRLACRFRTHKLTVFQLIARNISPNYKRGH